MNNDEIVNRLTSFGLSEKEALAYVTILRNGTTRISVVSDETGISTSYAYDIVEKLAERNLIEIDDHVNPAQLRAIPPSEGIGNLVSELHTIETRLEDLFDTESYEQESFSIIKSRRTILARLSDLIAAAETEIILSLPLSVLSQVEDSLRAAQERGVFCMLLVTQYDDRSTIDESVANVVQTWTAPAPVILTVDRSDGIVTSAEPVLNSNSNEYAIYHAEDHIVSALFDSFIANYWIMGSQKHVAKAPLLPQSYTSFRHAVFDATLHLRDGSVIESKLDIRQTQAPGPYETIEGTIVDVKQSLVRPFSNEFPTQESLVVEHNDQKFTVGGAKAFIEDFQAKDVTLERSRSP